MYKNNFLYISLPSHMNAIVRLKNEYKNLQKKLPQVITHGSKSGVAYFMA